MIFFVMLKTVCCVYSLESPRWGDSNEYTQHTFISKEIEKSIPTMLPDLALWLTLISSIYPCLEHIYMAPYVFRAIKGLLYVQNESRGKKETAM